MEFSVKDLKLKPEHLKDLRTVEKNKPKQQRPKREFIQITRDQFNRLWKAKNVTTWKVFLHLLFLNWKSPGRTIRLANGVSRAKRRRPTVKKPRLVRAEEAWSHKVEGATSQITGNHRSVIWDIGCHGLGHINPRFGAIWDLECTYGGPSLLSSLSL
jgi:hypothetical protein